MSERAVGAVLTASHSRTSDEDHTTLANVYCHACNELFSAETTACPRCGVLGTVSARDGNLETMLLPHGDEAALENFPTELRVDDTLLDGQQLGIYSCHKLLGRGGMGVVYLARNLKLQRLCALKVLSPRRTANDIDYVARFENEGRAAAALVHPHIVTTHAIGQAREHRYLEMEYVAGASLQHEIDSHGPLAPLRATMMAAGIASGLAAAHRLNIVHRDLKPDNVLVTPAGLPKIADFGLAKRLMSDDFPAGNLAGTPYFMAPELFEGRPASTASDVYALGVCYYLMLTGRFPFEGNSASAIMKSILTSPYPGARRIRPEIPIEMAEAVATMLSREDSRRPRDGTAVSALLQAILGSSRDLTSLVFDAFHGLNNIACDPSDTGFIVQLTLRNGRQQKVHIENSDHSADDRLLLIFSVCCKADPAFYEEALRMNALVPHGGLSIRDIDGIPHFVMVDTYPRATVDGEEIRRSVIEIGTHADHVEQMLTGLDKN
jgi:eukaryotic-like serine/threonine-protein kinase